MERKDNIEKQQDMATEQQALTAMLEKALQTSEVPKVYTNGFANFHGNSDMGIVFQLNGNPTVVVNMSFTLAKTLAQKLSALIRDLESRTGQSILSTEDIEQSQTK